jgi:hypothetical protein
MGLPVETPQTQTDKGQRLDAFDVWLDQTDKKGTFFSVRLRRPTGDVLIPCIALKILVSIASVYFLE